MASVGKRLREREKLEKARAKEERKAARQAARGESLEDSPPPSESKLMEELANLQRALEAGQVSDEDFAASQERIQAAFQRLLR
jgi:hypothetical protein